MHLKRFFIKMPFEVGSFFELQKEAYHYIVSVMRLKEQDEFLLNNNTEYDFLAKIEEIKKQSLKIQIKQKTLNTKEPKVQLTLCQALVKGEKFDLIAQKATELGVSDLIGFSTKFTVVKDNTQKLDRVQKISEQASSQCGRAKALNIHPLLTLKTLVPVLQSYDLILLAYEKAQTPLKQIFKKVEPNLNKVAIIVGSEGGFAKEEIDYLSKNLKNLKAISLGQRILRAESAAIVLSALVMYQLGELN